MADQSKMSEPHERTKQGEVPHKPHRHVHWFWPLGLAVAGIGSAASFMLRGCWHTQMSWPIRFDDEFSYQVCTGCGVKRLYDQRTFHAYGPYGYDLHDLIAHERAARLRRLRKHEGALAKKRAATSPQPLTRPGADTARSGVPEPEPAPREKAR